MAGNFGCHTCYLFSTGFGSVKTLNVELMESELNSEMGLEAESVDGLSLLKRSDSDSSFQASPHYIKGIIQVIYPSAKRSANFLFISSLI